MVQLKDRVKQGTSTTGSGTITFDVSYSTSGFQDFSSLDENSITYYVIEEGVNWEVGAGVYSTGTLTRDSVFASNNSDDRITLGGSGVAYLTLPADRTIISDNANVANVTGISVGLTGVQFSDGTIQTTKAVDTNTTYTAGTGLTLAGTEFNVTGIDGTMITDGSLLNADLLNSSVSYGGVIVSLGASDATPAFDLSDATSYPTTSLVGTVTNAQLAGSIENGKLTNSSVTVTAGSGLSNGGAVSLGGSVTIDSDSATTSQLGVVQLQDSATNGTVDKAITPNAVYDISGVLSTSIASTGATNAASIATNITNIATNVTNIAATGASSAADIAATGATNATAIATKDNYSNWTLQGDAATTTSIDTTETVQFTGAGDVTVSLGGTDNRTVTISGSGGGGGTTYTAGTGLALAGTEFNITGIDGTMITDGSLLNADLLNSSVNYGGVTVSLGASDTTPAFDLSDATDYPTSALVGTITNAQLAGSIENGKLLNSDVTITAGTGLSNGGLVSLGGSVTIDSDSATTAQLGVVQLQDSATNGTVDKAITPNAVYDISGVLSADIAATGASSAADIAATGATNATAIATKDNYSNWTLQGDAATTTSIDTTETVQFTGAGSVTVVLGGTDNRTVTISGTGGGGGGTTYTAGTGLTLAGTEFNITGIDGTMITDGSLLNADLLNSSVSYGGVSVSLGASDTTPAFDLSDATSYPTTALVGTITNAQLAGSIENGKLLNSDVTVTAGTGLSNGGLVSLGGTISIDADSATTAQLGVVQLQDSITDGTVDKAVTPNAVYDMSGVIASDIAATGATNAASIATNVTNIATNVTNIAATGASSAADIAATGALSAADIAATGATNATAIAAKDNYSNWTLQGDTATTTNIDTTETVQFTGDGNITVSLGGTDNRTVTISGSGSTDTNTTYTAGTGLALAGTEFNITGIDGTMITDGSLLNADLLNSSVSYGGVSVSLGASDATPAFDLSDATSYPTTALVGTITNAQLAGSIENGKLLNSDVTVTAGTGLSNGGLVSLGGTISIDSDSATTAQLGVVQLQDSITDGTVDKAVTPNAVYDMSGVIASDIAATGASSAADIAATGALSAADIAATGATNATAIAAKDNYSNWTLQGDTATTTNIDTTETVQFTGDGNITVSLGGTDNRTVTISGSGSTDTNTTYTAGTGLALAGTEFNITGIDGTMITDGSLLNADLLNSSVNYGGVSVSLGASDTTPAFDLSDATDYPTSALVGTITNAQLAGSIENGKLTNSDVTVTAGTGLGNGGTVALGASISVDITGIDGTMITDGSILNADLLNSSVNYGGVSVSLGASDTTPAFDLSDATDYPTSALVGTITNAQLAGSIENGKLLNSDVTITAGTGLSNGGLVSLGGTISIDSDSATTAQLGVVQLQDSITDGTVDKAVTPNAVYDMSGVIAADIAATGASSAADIAATGASSAADIAATGATNATAIAAKDNYSNWTLQGDTATTTNIDTTETVQFTGAGSVVISLGGTDNRTVTISGTGGGGGTTYTAGTGLNLDPSTTFNVSGSTINNSGIVQLQDSATDGTIDRGITPNAVYDISGVLRTSISLNTTNISENTSDIATNTSNIATNTADIYTNTTGIATNVTNIANNSTNISTNASNISTNTANIAINTSDIGANTTRSVNNAANIGTNTADIAANATCCANNLTNITANTTSIGNNAVCCAENATDIAATGATNSAARAAGDAINAADIAATGATNAAAIAAMTLDTVTDNGPTTTNNITVGMTTTSGVITPLPSGSGGSTRDFNLSTASTFAHTLAASSTTVLSVSNVTDGQKFMIRLRQNVGDTGLATWFGGIRWAEGGIAPTLTATAAKSDVFGFLTTRSGEYDGFVVGQNI